jgi:hypothetical protein
VGLSAKFKISHATLDARRSHEIELHYALIVVFPESPNGEAKATSGISHLQSFDRSSEICGKIDTSGLNPIVLVLYQTPPRVYSIVRRPSSSVRITNQKYPRSFFAL